MSDPELPSYRDLLFPTLQVVDAARGSLPKRELDARWAPQLPQAKKYIGSVGPENVRELRGALAGRADKGILITTGRFTKRAVEEANRAGAPIDLIDGERLSDLLLQYELGVHVRPVIDRQRLDNFNA